MPLINSAQDLLYVAIALAVLLLAIFTCWAIFYLAMILRQSFQVVKEMRDRLHKVDELVEALKEKITHSASYLLLIGEGVKRLVEVMQNRGEKKETRKKRT
ncbi:MAG: hypothetical protein PHS62_04000 [Patescibacteria group bacterium]|nr:hypothetical protein [Patescibacteria group bacterium]